MINRYLDICEMIEDPDTAETSNPEELKNTDIPSLTNQRLPAQNFLPENKRQKLKDWCLKMSLDRNDEIKLPTKSCPKCN